MRRPSARPKQRRQQPVELAADLRERPARLRRSRDQYRALAPGAKERVAPSNPAPWAVSCGTLVGLAVAPAFPSWLQGKGTTFAFRPPDRAATSPKFRSKVRTIRSSFAGSAKLHSLLREPGRVAKRTQAHYDTLERPTDVL